MNKGKLTSSIPVHLTDDFANAVKNLAFSEDMKPSKWVRQLVEREVRQRRLQAQTTMQALGNLANCENDENDFGDDDDDL